MSEELKKKLVTAVYHEAKKRCARTTPHAIAKKVRTSLIDKTGKENIVSVKTVMRAFARYVDDDLEEPEANEYTLNDLSEYLGYVSYEDYVLNYESTEEEETENEPVDPVPGESINEERIEKQEEKDPSTTRQPIGVMAVAFVGILSTAFFVYLFMINSSKCMIWDGKHYVEIPCDSKQNINFGPVTIHNYNNGLIDNFVKIEVDTNTRFFAEGTKEPLVWYGENEDGELDYFSSSGEHPVTGEQLVPISEDIIEKHITKPVAKTILNPSVINSPGKKDIGIFIFNGNKLDRLATKELQKGIFKNDKVTPYLISPGKMDYNLQNELLGGNIRALGATVKKHVDEICVGTISYNYEENTSDPKTYTCSISLDYDLFLADGTKVDEKGQSEYFSGMGFSKNHAKRNVLQKLKDLSYN